MHLSPAGSIHDLPTTGRDTSPAPSPGSSRIDYFVYALILAFGALQFFLYQRSPDFIHEDVSFFEMAKSILQNGFYGFNGIPEKVQPPGLAILLAGICATFGCTHAILLRAMPVFLTLGFFVSYELIKRDQGRGIAAATYLVLAASPTVFVYATQAIFPSSPYFVASMSALLVAAKLDKAKSRSAKIWWGVLLAFLGIASLMIQSVGLALFVGLLGWLVASFLVDSVKAKSRLKVFLPILVLGLCVEGLWMHRGSNPPEWPLHGYPGSYLSQLVLKSGNNPEMGMATPKDIALRVDRNLSLRVSLFGELVTRHWVNPSWSTLGTAGIALLIVIGVASSLLDAGGNPWDWYFVVHECIYLLWPWPVEIRFFLPIAPLACLYLYKGARTIIHFSKVNPRRLGVVALVPCMLFSVYSGIRGLQAAKGTGLQYEFSSVFWFVAACVSAWMAWKNSIPFLAALSAADRGLSKEYFALGQKFTGSHVLWSIPVVLLVLVGVSGQIAIGKENYNFATSNTAPRPDIEAAEWIRLHTKPSAVIAARHVPLVYHYAQRKVVWFPPLTNPQVLLQGIRRHHIQYIVVIDRDFSYYMPPDEDCFDKLNRAYPAEFRLAVQEGSVRIYEVLSELGS